MVRKSWKGKRKLIGTVATVLTTLATVFALNTPAARADSAPDPGGPGPLAFPAFSPSSFANPPAATRVKFRWWQPVADTNDTEIQREVNAMAGNFGGGFEQNGFAVSMNCGGCTSQFLTLAASQQFGQQYGWAARCGPTACRPTSQRPRRTA